MITRTKLINSVESPDDSHPWYVTDVESGDVVVTEDKDGGQDADLQNARSAIPTAVDLPIAATMSQSEYVTYAVTADGQFLSFDPVNADVPDLRAILGFYTAEDDTLTLLEFVER